MRIIAFIEQPEVIEKILTHLGIWPAHAHRPPNPLPRNQLAIPPRTHLNHLSLVDTCNGGHCIICHISFWVRPTRWREDSQGARGRAQRGVLSPRRPHDHFLLPFPLALAILSPLARDAEDYTDNATSRIPSRIPSDNFFARKPEIAQRTEDTATHHDIHQGIHQRARRKRLASDQ